MQASETFELEVWEGGLVVLEVSAAVIVMMFYFALFDCRNFGLIKSFKIKAAKQKKWEYK